MRIVWTWIALAAAMAPAACGDDGGGNGGLNLTQPYSYAQSGDCSKTTGLPESGGLSSFNSCKGTSFTFGQGTFVFNNPTGDGTWNQNTGCPAKFLKGKIECQPGANYAFSFDCNGCKGTVTVGTP